ncbi:MAG TPA: hypothetical protein VML50_17545 [Anaeromyxobacter sp.]|nr:hypothetical protein [Anaeromyxobacter sp.]
MSVALDTPYLDDGIRSINFFNGRLLSGEDLTQERLARQAVLGQLGRAAGDGIAYGLWVGADVGGSTITSPAVTVGKGLAVNRLGQALELVKDLEVSLVAPSATQGTAAGSAPGGGTGFGACSLAPGDYLAGAGVYLLLLSPAQGKLGRAPTSGLGLTSPSCAAKYVVDGVQFRMLRLPIAKPDLEDPARLRNRVAHQCFGTADPSWTGAVTNPFGPVPGGWGLLDTLRPDTLTDCDVPLAVFHWTDVAGIRFVDNWSVRRRLAVTVIEDRLAPLASARRRTEAEAMLLQFQEQVDALRSAAALNGLKATDAFDWLPPAGVLPLAGPGGQFGLDPDLFFDGFTVRKVAVIEEARAPLVLEGARPLPAIRCSSAPLVWRYLVRENELAAFATPSAGAPVLLFATAHAPYLGDARFNLAHWGYASFGVGRPGGA